MGLVAYFQQKMPVFQQKICTLAIKDSKVSRPISVSRPILMISVSASVSRLLVSVLVSVLVSMFVVYFERISCIPATSTAVERIFSQSGLMIPNKR